MNKSTNKQAKKLTKLLINFWNEFFSVSFSDLVDFISFHKSCNICSNRSNLPSNLVIKPGIMFVFPLAESLVDRTRFLDTV